MNIKYFKALGAVILLAFISYMMTFVFDGAISLFSMRDKITFSSTIIMCAFGFPLIVYGLLSAAFFFIFDRPHKYNNIIGKPIVILAISSLFFSFPISWYVDYKLKNDGYTVCAKISWQSPTTYVKHPSLCEI